MLENYQNWPYANFTFSKSDVLVPILHTVWNLRNVKFAVQQSLPQDHIWSPSPILIVLHFTIYSCNHVFETVNKTVQIQLLFHKFTVYGSDVRYTTFKNCMRATDNLHLLPKHIMTSLSESPCLIIAWLNVINCTIFALFVASSDVFQFSFFFLWYFTFFLFLLLIMYISLFIQLGQYFATIWASAWDF